MFECPQCGRKNPTPGFCPVDGTQMGPEEADPLIGAEVGSYRIERLLGVGGMGQVYKGVHPDIGSRVAVKVLSYECAKNSDMVARFKAEAKAANDIQHENIINILDFGKLPDGRPYIIMEYLRGAALADIVRNQGALPLGGLARLICEVLSALHASHQREIVHRDLKPDNIFVSPQGRAKVLDFGVAKLKPELSGRDAVTKTGSLLGTPHYMAPEQALQGEVDARTDIYAVGVILYEGVTGQRPFHADSLFKLLHKHINEHPAPPRSLRPDLPPDYESVILRAMAKDPAHRFQSAAELAQALEQVGRQLPASAWSAVVPQGGASSSDVATPGPTPMPTPMTASMAGSTAGASMTDLVPQKRTGLWLAMAVILLAAGGGAAAWVASRSGERDEGTSRISSGVVGTQDQGDPTGKVAGASTPAASVPETASDADLAHMRKHCKAEATRAEVLRRSRGQLVMHAHDAREKRYLAFLSGKDRCIKIAIGRADARKTGAFGDNGEQRKAFVVHECRFESRHGENEAEAEICYRALAIRELSGTMIDAVLIDTGKNQPDLLDLGYVKPTLTSADWFATPQRVIIVAGWHDMFQDVGHAMQRFAVYRLKQGRLRRLLHGPGSTAHSHDESCSAANDQKLTYHPHRIEVVKRGARAEVDVIRPPHVDDFPSAENPFGSLSGAKHGTKSRYLYDPKRGVFTLHGKAVPADVTGTERCGLP